MSAMKTSSNGIHVLHFYESCRLTAYPDPGTGKAPWTIGWGHTGPQVKPGLVWTQKQADDTFIRDLARFERDVNALLKVAVTQGQFDALVCFAYNVGADIDEDTLAEGLGDSSLLRFLNAGQPERAAAQFPLWNKAGGQVMRGLTRRRYSEQALFRGAGGTRAITIGQAF
ncbi:Phage lysin |nr:Phage lysin \